MSYYETESHARGTFKCYTTVSNLYDMFVLLLALRYVFSHMVDVSEILANQQWAQWIQQMPFTFPFPLQLGVCNYCTYKDMFVFYMS